MSTTRVSSRRLVATFLGLAFIVLPIAAEGHLTNASNARVGFNAVGPAGMQIVGSSDDLTVQEDAKGISVKVPLSKITTGIALRDRHMHEKYLEVGKFPNAELVVARSAVHEPAAGASADGSANGNMTIHGKSRSISFRYTAKRDGNVLHVSGSAPLNMNDFGIETPSYMGVHVKPDVELFFRFDVTDNP